MREGAKGTVEMGNRAETSCARVQGMDLENRGIPRCDDEEQHQLER